MRRIFYYPLVASVICTAAIAQSPADPPPRSAEDSAKAFIEHRASQQRARASGIADPGNLRDLNGLVRAAQLRKPRPGFVQDTETLAALEQSFLTDIAQELAQFGFRAGDLRKPGGGRFVEAMAARIRGLATVAQEAMLGDTVVLGTVVEAPDPVSDLSYQSSLGVRVDETYKGRAAKDDVIVVRRLTGSDGAGRVLTVSSEDPIPAVTRVLLIGSNAAYLATQSRTSCRSCVVETVPLFLVDGATLKPTGGYGQAGTLSAVKEGASS